MAKDSFVMYKSWAEMMTDMPDKELAELVKAIACYQTGKEYAIDNPMVAAVFNMIRDQFDKDNEKYEETCKRRSENGKKGVEEKAKASKSKQKLAKASKSKQKLPDNESDSDSEYESDIEKEGAKAPKKEKAQKRFIPPTLEEVKEYCEQRKNGIDAQHFIDYYASQKWKKANGQPLTDWEAGVRTWEAKNKEKARSGTKNQFNSFEQRPNNFDEIESKMFNRRLTQ